MPLSRERLPKNGELNEEISALLLAGDIVLHNRRSTLGPQKRGWYTLVEAQLPNNRHVDGVYRSSTNGIVFAVDEQSSTGEPYSLYKWHWFSRYTLKD